MTNPNDLPEVCECGHEEPDHFKTMTHEICTNFGCLCDHFKPRDAYWYAERSEDAAIAKAEERNER